MTLTLVIDRSDDMSDYQMIKVETEEQSIFDIDIGSINQDDLVVYVNGIRHIPGEHFTKINSHTIEFKEYLLLGDVILVSSGTNDLLENIDYTLVGNKKDSLFKRYGKEQRLKYNHLYKVDIKLSGENYSFEFSSRYSPLYQKVKNIRMDLLDVIDNVTDEQINYTIWQNSILANEMAENEVDEDNPAFYVKQWVRYKTEIDIIYAIYLAISGKFGSVSKKLGAMTIDRKYRIPFLKDMLDELKDKLKPFEDKLMGVKVAGTPARKAGGNDYPIGNERRSF